ncbi:complement factor H-like [Emydura macquarii macquarii]|uniref:complement factor H-like n=1 Tax=Emydura macquarii macquarii TaxID=1129001 RepID=UPI00352A09BA
MPFCKEVRCDPPSVNNGTYLPQMRVFREKDVIRVECNRGFHFENENRQNTAECTRDGWLPNPRCILRPCEKPQLENGALSDYYENYEERAFPARLGSSKYYTCRDGYVSKSEDTWNLIRCTREGWDPVPKCLRICSVRNLENGAFRYSYWKTYKEGDEISYMCDDEYIPENHQAKVTCTKNGWSPTPRCIFNKRCEKIEIQNGYFYGSANRFNLKEAATYRCQMGYTTPEGNEMGKTQCLPEGWSPFPKCIEANSCGVCCPCTDHGSTYSLPHLYIPNLYQVVSHVPLRVIAHVHSNIDEAASRDHMVPLRDFRAHQELLKRVASNLNLTIREIEEEEDTLFNVLGVDAPARVALPIHDRVLKIAKALWQTPASVAPTSKGAEKKFLLTLVIDAANQRDRQGNQGSTPKNKNNKKLNLFGRKVYSMGALQFRIANR